MNDLTVWKDLVAYGSWGLATTIGCAILWHKYGQCLERERHWWATLHQERLDTIRRLELLVGGSSSASSRG